MAKDLVVEAVTHVTQAEVQAVVDLLMKRGEQPSISKVRRELKGRGSNETIAKVLRRLKPTPDEPAKTVEGTGQMEGGEATSNDSQPGNEPSEAGEGVGDDLAVTADEANNRRLASLIETAFDSVFRRQSAFLQESFDRERALLVHHADERVKCAIAEARVRHLTHTLPLVAVGFLVVAAGASIGGYVLGQQRTVLETPALPTAPAAIPDKTPREPVGVSAPVDVGPAAHQVETPLAPKPVDPTPATSKEPPQIKEGPIDDAL